VDVATDLIICSLSQIDARTPRSPTHGERSGTPDEVIMNGPERTPRDIDPGNFPAYFALRTSIRGITE
ncbi:hypothetical protein, partial [Nocardia farcinica]|uniref:hypothetical protein n=1 Tax=Nocardia farcinica TaxID=37329 RepID=UPI001C0EFCDB